MPMNNPDAYGQMHDLGEPVDADMSVPESARDDIFYPSVHLNTKQMPSLRDANIGETMKLVVEVEVAGADVREEETSYRLELKRGMLKPAKTSRMKHVKVASEDELPTRNDRASLGALSDEGDEEVL